MSRARRGAKVYVTADDLDRAAEGLCAKWSIDGRQRWVLDLDAPAAGRQAIRTPS